MKNKIKIYCLTVIFIFSSLIFCSYSKNKNITVKGYIHSHGSQPFTFLGIEEINSKKEYAISASEDVLKELQASQGNEIEITGTIIKKNGNGPEFEMLKDGKIIVLEWKYVK